MKKFIYIAMAMLSAFAITNCTPDQQKELLAKIANQTLRGEGAPAPELGAIGNYYFDEKNSDLYGPKTAEGWGTPVSLKDFKGAKGDKGEPGANGTKIYTGEGKPSDEIGAIGDWYFDTKTKTFYGPKTDKGWGDKTADISGGKATNQTLAAQLNGYWQIKSIIMGDKTLSLNACNLKSITVFSDDTIEEYLFGDKNSYCNYKHNVSPSKIYGNKILSKIKIIYYRSDKDGNVITEEKEEDLSIEFFIENDVLTLIKKYKGETQIDKWKRINKTTFENIIKNSNPL